MLRFPASSLGTSASFQSVWALAWMSRLLLASTETGSRVKATSVRCMHFRYKSRNRSHGSGAARASPKGGQAASSRLNFWRHFLSKAVPTHHLPNSAFNGRHSTILQSAFDCLPGREQWEDSAVRCRGQSVSTSARGGAWARF